MFCTHCGKELPDDAQFCPNCGQRIASGETPENHAALGGQPVAAGQEPVKKGHGLLYFLLVLILLICGGAAFYLTHPAAQALVTTRNWERCTIPGHLEFKLPPGFRVDGQRSEDIATANPANPIGLYDAVFHAAGHECRVAVYVFKQSEQLFPGLPYGGPVTYEYMKRTAIRMRQIHMGYGKMFGQRISLGPTKKVMVDDHVGLMDEYKIQTRKGELKREYCFLFATPQRYFRISCTFPLDQEKFWTSGEHDLRNLPYVITL